MKIGEATRPGMGAAAAQPPGGIDSDDSDTQPRFGIAVAATYKTMDMSTRGLGASANSLVPVQLNIAGWWSGS